MKEREAVLAIAREQTTRPDLMGRNADLVGRRRHHGQGVTHDLLEFAAGDAAIDLPPKAQAMAERAVLAHLEKLEADGLVKRGPQGFVPES